jgi:hypothetical protein
MAEKSRELDKARDQYVKDTGLGDAFAVAQIGFRSLRRPRLLGCGAGDDHA